MQLQTPLPTTSVAWAPPKVTAVTTKNDVSHFVAHPRQTFISEKGTTYSNESTVDDTYIPYAVYLLSHVVYPPRCALTSSAALLRRLDAATKRFFLSDMKPNVPCHAPTTCHPQPSYTGINTIR